MQCDKKKTIHKKHLNPGVARWLSYLQDYNFTVEYRKGKYVSHIDCLSYNTIVRVPKVNVVRRGTWLETKQTKYPEIQEIIQKVLAGESITSDYKVKNELLL